MKSSAWYGILVGLLMIAQWIFSIVTGGVPQFQTAPWTIAFHIAAEMSTAPMLLIGGVAVLKSMPWANQVLLLGLDMVIYSEIVRPGYFAQRGRWAQWMRCDHLSTKSPHDFILDHKDVWSII